MLNGIEIAIQGKLGFAAFLVAAGDDKLCALVNVGQGLRVDFGNFGIAPVKCEVDEQRGADAFVEGHQFFVYTL